MAAPNAIIAGIPAYNEEATVDRIVRDVRQYVDHVVVVDDGSTDRTAERARDAGATVLQHRTNQGYGASLETIFLHAYAAGVEQLVILDGDGQHDPADIPALLTRQLETGAEIVVASRYVAGPPISVPRYRRFGLAIVNLLMNSVLRWQHGHSGLSDTQSGFRAYKADAVQSIAESNRIGNGMDASLGILFHAARYDYQIEEIPTEIQYDVENRNTHNPVLHGFQLVFRILWETVNSPGSRAGIAVLLPVIFLVLMIGSLLLLGNYWGVTAIVATVGIAALLGVMLSTTARSLLSSIMPR